MSGKIVAALVLALSVTATSQGPKEIVGEGVIVAFQKANRCASCVPAPELGTRVEFWIVRVDSWVASMARPDKYILVKYKLYERGLSDEEINSDRLRFALREPRNCFIKPVSPSGSTTME